MVWWPQGAYTVHSYAVQKGYEQTITDVAKIMINNLNVIAVVGLVENWKEQLAHIEIFNPKEIFIKEPKLLNPLLKKIACQTSR